MTLRISKLHIGLVAAVIVLLAVGIYSSTRKDGMQTSVDPFLTACVEPALAGFEVGQACRSIENIRATYNIDIEAQIEKKRARMAATAQRIAADELQDPLIYKACIARDECAEVPLLPPGVDISDPSRLTKSQLEISTAFWDLAEKKKMTPSVCNLIPECRAMVKLSVINYGF